MFEANLQTTGLIYYRYEGTLKKPATAAWGLALEDVSRRHPKSTNKRAAIAKRPFSKTNPNTMNNISLYGPLSFQANYHIFPFFENHHPPIEKIQLYRKPFNLKHQPMKRCFPILPSKETPVLPNHGRSSIFQRLKLDVFARLQQAALDPTPISQSEALLESNLALASTLRPFALNWDENLISHLQSLFPEALSRLYYLPGNVKTTGLGRPRPSTCACTAPCKRPPACQRSWPRQSERRKAYGNGSQGVSDGFWTVSSKKPWFHRVLCYFDFIIFFVWWFVDFGPCYIEGLLGRRLVGTLQRYNKVFPMRSIFILVFKFYTFF